MFVYFFIVAFAREQFPIVFNASKRLEIEFFLPLLLHIRNMRVDFYFFRFPIVISDESTVQIPNLLLLTLQFELLMCRAVSLLR